ILDDHRRDVSNQGHGSLLCDLDLSSGWYRFLLNGSNAEIPTSCVQPNHCGTQAPIWLHLDPLPEAGQEVTSVACSSWAGQGQKVNCCFYPYRVSVKNCGMYLVYKLGSSLACNIAHCAQAVSTTVANTPTTADGLPPSIDETNGDPGCEDGAILDPRSQRCLGTAKILVEMRADDILLMCNVSSSGFSGLNASNMQRTQVTWCEQAHFDSTGVDCLTINSVSEKLLLGESVFAGQTIVCEVEVVSSEGGVKVFRSDPFFVGLQIKERELSVSDNGTASTLTLTSSVPIPCGSGFNSSFCRLGVNLLVFDTDGHYLPRVRFSTCFLEVRSSQCGEQGCEEMTVEMALFPDPQGKLAQRDVVLVAGITYTGPGAWAQSSLDVKVHLEESDFGSCHVITDPHILTFDGKLFDLYRTGTFTLYYSSFLDFTVELRVAPCPGLSATSASSSPGFCTCGLVVTQADDVISVDNCHLRQRQGRVEVTYPLGAISRDVRLYEHDTKRAITIVFLSGRRLRIYVETFGLNIGLFIPSLERGRGRGLCGNYDNDPSNDFMMQNGASVTQSVNEFIQALEFIESWRVQPSRSRFEQPQVEWKVSPAPLLGHVRCDCSPSSAGDVCPVTPFFQDTLTSVLATKEATDRFYTRATFPDQRDSETASDENSKRKSYYFRWDHLISSQLFLPTWPTVSGIQEEMADEACAQFLFQAPLTLICADYGFVGLVVSTAFDLCKKDIQVKDDMSWANHSTRLIESFCEFAILSRADNFTSQGDRTTPSSPAWPIALRDAIGCPVGCGRGKCDQGRCLCEVGFTGEACNTVIGD
ncbi:hypothetical protein EGW08_005310, partial [Elysia chlorotica]